ncbi:APH(3'') family aminoglycoside O-phosphotransferase [Actinosynnema sp. NPDC059335]|uniref:APH(3'') family aminoglycoside O-phosphotransferase n=1 Tax=Actinosynnema sp. NPDC059335 TaxID=3346804 RepID=UPI00367197C3
MTSSSPAFRSLLRAVGGEWEPVTSGESGAGVFRSEDGSRYAKCVLPGEVASLEAERDRVAWLGGHGIPGPRVVDWRGGADGAVLVTTAVAGVPADSVPAPTLMSAWGAIADAVRGLHALPARDCPFSRDLTSMHARARDVVGRGAVKPEFLLVEDQRTPPEELLARLTPQVQHRLAQEADDTVVCHGDLCLPNIILDPDSLTVAGFVDLGRLGRADRYADIALLLASSRLEKWTDDRQADSADELFAARYGIALDRDRERFYLHLDPLTWD